MRDETHHTEMFNSKQPVAMHIYYREPFIIYIQFNIYTNDGVSGISAQKTLKKQGRLQKEHDGELDENLDEA
jgi:hypothetical protein